MCVVTGSASPTTATTTATATTASAVGVDTSPRAGVAISFPICVSGVVVGVLQLWGVDAAAASEAEAVAMAVSAALQVVQQVLVLCCE